jgi:hypothetical protein
MCPTRAFKVYTGNIENQALADNFKATPMFRGAHKAFSAYYEFLSD